MTTPPQQPPDRLVVGIVPGVTLTKWATIWRDRFPAVRLEVVEVSEAEQRRALEQGRADLCLVRLPLLTDGLHLIPLYQEVPVAWVSREHPLAAYDEVGTPDLAGEDVLTDATPDAINLVALEVAVLRVPMSIARSHSRRDLVYRPVTDAEPTTVGLAWRVDNPHPSIDEFIGVVRG
ncbi:MAG: LysR family substrate-binding domain-containing protein, partial [Propionicimonas sp.]